MSSLLLPTMPHRPEAETWLVGRMLALGELPQVASADFHDYRFQLIVAAGEAVQAAGGKPHAVPVAEHLESNGKLSDATTGDGAAFLCYVMDSMPDVQHPAEWAAAVRSAAQRRRTYLALRKASERMRDPSISPADVLASLQTDPLLQALPPSQHQPRAVVNCLADIEAKPVSWLWEGRIPLGKLSLIQGDPGTGKSHLTVDIAARVTRGTAWPDGSAGPAAGEVLFLCAEDDPEDTLRPRLDRAGADVSKVFILDSVEAPEAKTGKRIRRGFNLQHDIERLAEIIDAHPDLRLIIIDPLSSYCGKTDTHRNSDVRTILGPLIDLAARKGVAVIGVAHLNKSTGGKAIYRGNGSLAFSALARAVWHVTKDCEQPDRRLLLPVKLNLSEEPAGLAFGITDGCLAWERTPVARSADDQLALEAGFQTEEGDGRQERRDAADFLRDRLTDGPCPSTELLKDGREMGHSEKTLRRAFRSIGGSPRKDGMSGGWVWELPAFEDGHSPGTGHLREKWPSSAARPPRDLWGTAPPVCTETRSEQRKEPSH